MNRPSKTVFITGATSGIGLECAKIFARNHFNLILTGRRKEKLEALKKQLESEYAVSVLTLCYDVKDKTLLPKMEKEIAKFCSAIQVLINNAGLALGKDNFEYASLDDWDTMIDTNIKGVYYTTRLVLPFLLQSSNPHIFNMSSIAGTETYENGNVYCASKAAVNSLSEAMRIDLLKKNIRITAICPGAVETEFSLVRFKGDADKAKQVYERFMPLSGKDIAEVIYYCHSLPKHVNINTLTINPTAQANAFYFNKGDV